MNKKIRFGVIGTNFITDRFLSGALMDERFELSAVYSRQLDKATLFAAKYGVKNVFTNFADMLNFIDAIYIASPNCYHADQAIYFMDRGKHVLCEKALCSNLKEAKAMVAAAKRNNVCFMEAIINILNPNFLALKKALIHIAPLRKYFASYCQYSSRYDKFKQGIIENAFKLELSNGALLDIGIYTIYPMLTLFGKPKTIKASGNKLSTGVDASGSIIFEYESQLEACVIYSKISNSLLPAEIQGEAGTLQLDKINTPRNLTLIDKNNNSSSIDVPHCGNDYFYELKEFIDTITKGEIEHPIASHNNALLVMEVLDEIRQQLGIVYPADIR